MLNTPKSMQPDSSNEPARDVKQSLSVEFYPSIDDHVHVSLKLGEAAAKTTLAAKLFNLFLLLNCIVFPAFLFINDYTISAILIFGINVLTVVFLVPRANSSSHREYYKKLYGNRENEIASVELSPEGIRYAADGCATFWSWHRVDLIEQTDDAVYFYLDGNGFGIRKAGFAYREEQDAFVDFANARIQDARSAQLTA
jgi:hypothetical protein